MFDPDYVPTEVYYEDEDIVIVLEDRPITFVFDKLMDEYDDEEEIDVEVIF